MLAIIRRCDDARVPLSKGRFCAPGALGGSPESVDTLIELILLACPRPGWTTPRDLDE
jgi:hypothetical protein